MAGALERLGVDAPAVVGGVAVLAGISATGKMTQTIGEIRTVNAGAAVFNPNTLLSRTNNG
ncbi:MAG TPA: hypothetical protein PKC73_00420 [Dermatophilaceae bacterium]|nr:hypothetical protein [Dermatophilaceae bacterium]